MTSPDVEGLQSLFAFAYTIKFLDPVYKISRSVSRTITAPTVKGIPLVKIKLMAIQNNFDTSFRNRMT